MALFNFGGNRYEPPAYFDHDSERQVRLERYRKTWEAYLAELPDPIIKDGPSNDNAKVNPARAIINTSVYFLFGGELKFQISPEAALRYGSEDQNIEGVQEVKVTDSNPDWLAALNRAWKANRKDSFLFNLGLSGSIHGNVFIKLVPNAAGMNNEYPRLLILDPANVDVEWDPNDCTRVLKYSIEYVTETDNGEPELRVQEITANQDAFGTIQSWTMQDYTHGMSYMPGTGWFPAGGERTPVGDPVEWPYAWAPIEHCQNIELPHMFWGLPDLDESSIEVIESIQRTMSSLNKIVRIHASPRLFAKGVMPDQVDDIDVSADNIITLPNMESDLNVLTSLQNIAPNIQHVEKMKKDLMEMVQVPAIALGEFNTAGSALSGVTLSILYAPILQKTELKRISYGDMLDRLNHKILHLMGFTDHENHESLVLVWPEAMPGSAFIERQTLQTDIQMGVSKRTVTSRLGYDPTEEERNRLEEMQAELEVQAKVQMEITAQAAKLAPNPSPNQEETRGGNNNPSGFGNRNGSMGGTQAAGTPKTPRE